MIIFEVTWEIIEDIFSFYYIYNIAKQEQKKEVLIFYNTGLKEPNIHQLSFLCTILYKLGLIVKTIIGRNIPHYYESVLLQGKLLGDFSVTIDMFEPNSIVEAISRNMVIKYFSDYKFVSSRDLTHVNADLKIHTLQDIRYIPSTSENILFLERTYNQLKDDCQRFNGRTKILKEELLSFFSSLQLCNINDISETVDIYKQLNFLVKMKEVY